MEATHKTEYNVRDLGTRAVILFPTRAQVFRDIKSVPLQPGSNEIVIHGLSPTVDEHSIKVEGSGAAIITDIAVESLPNRELFEDRYPESDVDEDEFDQVLDEFNDDINDDELANKYPEVRRALDRVVALQEELDIAQAAMDSAQRRMGILDAYNNTLDDKNDRSIERSLAVFKEEHDKCFQERLAAARKQRELLIDFNAASKELLTINTKKRAEWQKSIRPKIRARERRNKLKQEREKEKQRVMKERQGFWPKYCYSVRISLESNAYTPASSRRGSVSSDTTADNVVSLHSEKARSSTCDLTISYVTTSAYWAPNYDLQLSTTDSTASLCFDAQLYNSTSETWEDCKITLSTSQANSSVLDDPVPNLQPWRIKAATKSKDSAVQGIMQSREEVRQQQASANQNRTAQAPKRRADMFGLGGPSAPGPAAPGPSNHALQDYQMQLMLLEQQNKKRLMMARQEQDVNEYNRPVAAPQAQMMQQMLQEPPAPAAPTPPAPAPVIPQQLMHHFQVRQEQQQPPPPHGVRRKAHGRQMAGPDVLNEFDFDSFLQDSAEGDLEFGAVASEPLDFKESLIEETGFTTSYDLPGLKTLAPRSAASKQRVARITLAKVTFSHTAVPKYRAAAFLNAKLRNNSKLTLLRGPAGLTLDGSFVGRTTLPMCSAGDAFTLSLGVDPAIRVVYPKPEVRRTTPGVFSKEESSVYLRTVMVHNTRASTAQPIKLLVLDQVPVSEDERVRVSLATPRGLAVDGPAVEAGAPASDKPEDQEWGLAEARLKKGGQVSWVVSLNAGKRVKLSIEYAVSNGDWDYAVEC
jgi:hypothetical protein